MTRRRAVPAAALLVLALVPALARPDLGAPAPPLPAPRIFQMALDAPRLIDYEGTKVITALRGGRMETITVAESHKRPDGMRLEYLSPEDLAGRLIIDNGTVSWHYEPALNMAFQGPSFAEPPLDRDLTLLQRNYTITFLGTDEVIGRQADVIALDPVKGGVRRQLWVDRATGTVLRTEERDASRGVILSAYFSRISFSLNLPDASFKFRTPAGARVFSLFATEGGSLSPAALQARVRFPVLIPPVLPEGYTFRGAAMSRFGGLESVYLRYSNGGNLISFFEAPAGSIGWPAAGQPLVIQGRPARLVDLGYFRVLIWEQHGIRLTAVGTIPTGTLIAVAGQIAAAREQALVQDVAARLTSDPGTVSKLRGEGLTFPEIARTIVLSQRLGLDVATTLRFVRGSLTARELAARLDMPLASLQHIVQQAARDTARISALPSPAP